MKRRFWISVVAALLSVAVVIVLAACSSNIQQTGYPYGWGSGPGGMMGPGMMGPGMMGGGTYNPDAEPISLEEAASSVRRYLNAYGSNLELKEVMEFAWNYYAEVEERDTGVHAMELLVDKYTAQVYPEMGPNMMWNTRYGTMGHFGGGGAASDMPVRPDQARDLAQKYLDRTVPGLTVGEPDAFYGYYTIHTFKDGNLEGMLSVNGYTGAVWYHNWHGYFIQMREFGEK